MSRRSLYAPRLLALAALGWLLFDFPLLSLLVGRTTAMFVVWGVVIAMLALIVETRSDPAEAASAPGPASVEDVPVVVHLGDELDAPRAPSAARD